MGSSTTYRHLSLWFAAAIIGLALSSPAHGQVLYGSLTGNLTDASGAAVPNAKVEATNTSTGVSKATTTDDRGAYLFSDLQPGTYKVTISAPAFSTRVFNDVNVSLNSVLRLDAELSVSAVTETVSVTAGVAALQTDRAV
jgi:hypothetical protein